MEYYEYIGTQEQADEYGKPKPFTGNIYPSDSEIAGNSVFFWASGPGIISKEWKLVEKEQLTKELIELLNNQAAKDGLICSVTFDKKPRIEIEGFEINDPYFEGITKISFFVNLNPLQVQSKQSKLIESIINVLEND